MTARQTQNWAIAAFVGAAILAISALHFLTPIERTTAHQIYQRLYYLPVVASALFFGVRGGAAAALFVSAAYIPHIAFQWHHQPEYALNQYAEIVLFFSFGLVTGFLSDRNRRSHERAERINVELERSYAELRRTFEQLLQAERLTALGELSAGIVHEIRNPLGAIKGAVEILEDGFEAGNPRREFAGIAKTEVDRLNKLVQEFVDYARAPPPVTIPINPNRIVEAVASLIERQAAAQRVSVELKLKDDLPETPIDAEQIKQLLLNLAINALQAMPDGGKLAFRTTHNADAVTIAVEDTGSGISPAAVGRIFDPFFTTKNKGLGLGLSIAHKIARQHNGNLSAKNNAGGAVLNLVLPIAAE